MDARVLLSENPARVTTLRSARLPRIAAGLLVAIAAGVLGYLVGARGHQTVTTRTGVAYASDAQAVVQAGGWSYNIPLDGLWIDSQGTMHDRGRPACLPAYRQTPIVFGSVDVSATGMRSVVWVRC